MNLLSYLFYNMGPVDERVTNPRARLELNVHALGFPGQPAFKALAYAECVARQMPELPRYKRYRQRGAGVKGQRANVCLYLWERLEQGPAEWWDGELDWWRPRDPNTKHDPRSTLWVPIENDWLLGVGHAPEAPSRRWADHVNKSLVAARQEWMSAHVSRMRAHTGPVVLLADCNGLATELRRRVPKLNLAGHGPDACLTSETLIEPRFDTSMRGVDSWSDHHGFITGRVVTDGHPL